MCKSIIQGPSSNIRMDESTSQFFGDKNAVYLDGVYPMR